MKVDKFSNKKEDLALPSFIFPNCENLNSSLYVEILESLNLDNTIKGGGHRTSYSVEEKSSSSYLTLIKWIEELIPMSAHILAGGTGDYTKKYKVMKGGGKWGYDYNRFKIAEMWSIVYNKGEGVESHNHFPYPISFVYYVNFIEGSSPLIIESDEFFPKNGQLIFFMGHQYHCVPPSNIDNRCIIAGNINYSK